MIRHTLRHAFTPKNGHLLISTAMVATAALMYGVVPASVVPQFFDIRVETVDLANVFRAVMCIYLAVSGVWIAGILRPGLWRTATITNILFMASLTSGRIISLIFDGAPSNTLKFALLGELALALYGITQLMRYSRTPPINERREG